MKNFKKMIPVTLNVICLITPLSSVYAIEAPNQTLGEASEFLLLPPEYLAGMIQYPILCSSSACVTDVPLAQFIKTADPKGVIGILKAYKLMLTDPLPITNASTQAELNIILEGIDISLEELNGESPAPTRILLRTITDTFQTANNFVFKYFPKPLLPTLGHNNTRLNSKTSETRFDIAQTPVNSELTPEQTAAIKKFKEIYQKGQDATTLEIQELSSISNILKTLTETQLIDFKSELKTLKVTNPWNSCFLSWETLDSMLTK